jgi:hypothetical protein
MVNEVDVELLVAASKRGLDAIAANKKGDYATAMRLTRPLAEQGEASGGAEKRRRSSNSEHGNQKHR